MRLNEQGLSCGQELKSCPKLVSVILPVNYKERIEPKLSNLGEERMRWFYDNQQFIFFGLLALALMIRKSRIGHF